MTREQLYSNVDRMIKNPAKKEKMITMYIFASTYREFLDKEYKNKFNIYNAEYKNLEAFLKNPANKEEIIDTLFFYRIGLESYEENAKNLEKQKNRQVVGDIVTIGGTIAAAAVAPMIATKAIAATALTGMKAAKAVAVGSFAGAGTMSGLTSFAFNAFAGFDERIVYQTNRFLRRISDSIYVLSKNYRKISAVHTVSGSSLVFNDFQLLENANTVALSYFNANNAISGTFTQIAKAPAALFKNVSGPGGEKLGSNVTRFLFNFLFHMDDRNVGNLNDTTRWVTVDFTFHNFLPGDKRRSTVSLQPNALFIQQLGISEEKIVAANIMRQTLNEYYGGNIIVVGNPSIMVADKIYLSDNVNNMSGIFECREVTHIFNASRGFVTSVTPSMVANTDESILNGERDSGLRTQQVLTQIALPAAIFAVSSIALVASFRGKAVGDVAAVAKGASSSDVTNTLGQASIGTIFKDLLKTAGLLGPVGEKGNGFFKLAGKWLARGSMMSFASGAASWLNNLFRKTIQYPLSTMIRNEEVKHDIIVMEKRGEPMISNLDGLDKAELLKRKKSDLGFRIGELFRNLQEVSSDELEDYNELLKKNDVN